MLERKNNFPLFDKHSKISFVIFTYKLNNYEKKFLQLKQNRTEILFSLPKRERESFIYFCVKPNKHNLTDHCEICNKKTLVK